MAFTIFLKGLLLSSQQQGLQSISWKPWIGRHPLPRLCALAKPFPLEIRCFLWRRFRRVSVATLDLPFPSHGRSMGSSRREPGGFVEEKPGCVSSRSSSLSSESVISLQQSVLVPAWDSTSLWLQRLLLQVNRFQMCLSKMFLSLQF